MKKHILILFSFIFILIFCNFAFSAQDATILWYKFDENFDKEIIDRSPFGNNGIIKGNLKVEKQGKVGAAARFTGAESITVPLTDSLNVDENLTIEFWVKPNKVPAATYWRLIHKGWVENGSYICGIDNNWMVLGYTWDVKNTQGVRKDANMANAVVAETWQYYTATYDGQKITLYIDGKPLVQTPANGKINGKFDIIISENFSGLLDEIRFSNVALDEAEIKKHMEGEEVKAVDPQSKLSTTWAKIKSDI
ncbi:MAG: LamG domain-containing protein [bacterium]